MTPFRNRMRLPGESQEILEDDGCGGRVELALARPPVPHATLSEPLVRRMARQPLVL